MIALYGVELSGLLLEFLDLAPFVVPLQPHGAVWHEIFAVSINDIYVGCENFVLRWTTSSSLGSAQPFDLV